MGPTVLIVDDHREFRSSAQRLLDAEGFDVVGEAADGATAVTQAMLLKPDVVLLDINLPGMDGFAVAERLANLPGPPVIVLVSTGDATRYVARLAHSPARGFISKGRLSGPGLAELIR